MDEDAPTRAVRPGEPGRPTVRLFAPGTEISRRYEVRGVLGTGSAAVVYDAWDREHSRAVALKVVRADRVPPGALERLRREVALARDAASPRIVRVLEVGESAGTVFLAMEEVEGESLRDLLERGPLPVDRSVEIAVGALRALADLHALGIVHRDVKPGNVLLPSGGGVLLADFGLAGRWEGTGTRPSEAEALAGAAAYLAPEQALGPLADARSDLYSVGVVLFEMLAGRPPLRGGSAMGTVLAQVTQRPAPLRHLRPEVPAWLAAVVARLLEKDPVLRYATAAEVLADLEGRRARRRPWSGRRLLAASAVAAGALLLAAALLPVLPWNRIRVVRLVDAADGLRAVDVEGRVLWARDDLRAGEQAALVHGGSGELVAAVEEPPSAPAKHLSFLDPVTGRLRRRVPLDPGRPWSDWLSRHASSAALACVSLAGVDLDGDGADEIVATFVAETGEASSAGPVPAAGAASGTFVYDPLRERVAVTFASLSPHLLHAAVDVDGDGRREVVVRGIEARMGGLGGVAALRVPSGPGADGRAPLVTAPDEAPSGEAAGRALLWYALVPAAAGAERTVLPPDEARRRLPLALAGGRRAVLGFDGFLESGRSGLALADRERERDAAYEALRKAERLGIADSAEAAAEAARAGAAARRAGDPILAEWSDRVRAALLAAAGRVSEAGPIYAGVLATTGSPARVAAEAGDAFRRGGALAEAARWYRRALALGGAGALEGSEPARVLERLVLALGEAGRRDDAVEEIDRYLAARPTRAADAARARALLDERFPPAGPPPRGASATPAAGGGSPSPRSR